MLIFEENKLTQIGMSESHQYHKARPRFQLSKINFVQYRELETLTFVHKTASELCEDARNLSSVSA